MARINVEDRGVTMRSTLSALLLSLSVLGSHTATALAQTEFQILEEPVLTIRNPEEDTEERVRRIEERFFNIVDRASEERLEITVEGGERAARIAINGSMLLEVTAEDAAANATGKAIALAEVWAQRLRTILEQPEVSRELFQTANLPDEIVVAGRRYVKGKESVPDRGQFVTDGSRGADLVLFWVSEPEKESVGMPTPPPEQIYVINRFREFIPYRAI